MTFVPVIYDWRASLCPVFQPVRAGGAAVGGGLTLGGAAIGDPEPGGRLEVQMSFPAFWTGQQATRDVSWTLSRLMGWSVWRIRLAASAQLVPRADIFGTAAENLLVPVRSPADAGAPDSVWDPRVAVVAVAAIGAAQAVIDLAELGDVLQPGHVIGFRSGDFDFAHVVQDVTYDAGEATVTISPPLRRALTTSDWCYLRPAFLGVCTNAEAAVAAVPMRNLMGLAPLSFVEALV